MLEIIILLVLLITVALVSFYIGYEEYREEMKVKAKRGLFFGKIRDNYMWFTKSDFIDYFIKDWWNK